MRVAVNNHALPVYKKNRITSLLCIFESTISRNAKWCLHASGMSECCKLMTLTFDLIFSLINACVEHYPSSALDTQIWCVDMGFHILFSDLCIYYLDLIMTTVFSKITHYDWDSLPQF